MARRGEWLRRRARSLPAIAWRDRTIRRLQAENARLQELVDASVPVRQPSFRQHVHAARRLQQHMEPFNHPDRGNLIARKLKGYSFAQSHGVRIPTILALVDRPHEIPWESLPNRVVIKSHLGSTGRGVLPLRRAGDGWTVVTRDEPMATQQVADHLEDLRRRELITAPFFAEELLDPGPGHTLPLEVRVSAFYGEVSHVLLRRVRDHGNGRTAHRRRIAVTGEPAEGSEPDPALPLPACLAELVEVGRVLSAHVPHPYVRVDLYDVGGEVVFGELTPRPGSPEGLGLELDRRLGVLWEQAEARMLSDVVDGVGLVMRYGPHPRELSIGGRLYLPEHGWVAG